MPDLDIEGLRPAQIKAIKNLANEIIENIEAGLESFQALMEILNGE